jgi:flagellar biosynthesis GTPase FlhF
MELKRILAPDTRSATEKAKAMYGPDVLIISNHRVEGRTELIVAMDLSEATPEDLAQDDPSNFLSSNGLQSSQALGGTSQQFGTHLLKALKKEAVGEHQEALVSEPSNGHEDLLIQGREKVRSQEIVSLVREELAALRQEFRLSQQTASWQMNQYWPQHIQPLVQAMTEASVPTALRALLQEGLRGQPTLASGLASLQSQLSHNLKQDHGAFPVTGVHALAGLSGSGKSLMVAKIAQQFAMKYGAEQVAVLSYHDMRAGAWGQTQMLCAQLGVDSFRAANPETLSLLLEELSLRKLVLIDTPGVQMADRLMEITTACPSVGLHAVVPADSSGVTLSRIMLQSQFNWSSMLISKLDESNSPWPLIQFLIQDGAECVVSGGSFSDKLTDGLCESSVKKLINIAVDQLSPSVQAEKDVMMGAFDTELTEDTDEPALMETMTLSMGLGRPNWSIQLPVSEMNV